MAASALRFLRHKRDGGAHAPEEIAEFVAAYARGEVPDYQASAWLMAALLRGLDERETEALTRALIDSGRRFDWKGLGRPAADKHSTGGVGDKVSLVLAPLAAACGLAVPMVSGRGLGHTGGTLDKLESIPGFRTRLGAEEMARQMESLGVVMVGQGPELAPADGRLYALRDVTATVEFLPFIVSSIVSKKVAEGAHAIAYDVKCGSGAFMKTVEQARELGRRLVATSSRLGCAASALVTDMGSPLGRAVGNALEVAEAVETLRGGGPPDARELTLRLAAEMIALAEVEPDLGAARVRAERALDGGRAMELFLRLVAAQAGEAAAVEDPRRLPVAPAWRAVKAARAGYVAAIECQRLGELVVGLGAGRMRKEDAVDPRVGVVVERRPGDRVARGDTLATLHMARDDEGAVRACAECFAIAEAAPARAPLVLGRVGEGGRWEGGGG